MKKGADTVFGHEFCCEVLEAGPGVGRRLQAGGAGGLHARPDGPDGFESHRLFQPLSPAVSPRSMLLSEAC